jgi:hypothetical protein
MNNSWDTTLFPLFLSSLSSCTLASYTDEELNSELSNFAMRAIARFRFPRVSLKWTTDENNINVFSDENIGIKEFDVIVAWMKVMWLEYQLSKERNYENLYADKDVKAFSSGALISSIAKALLEMTDMARKVEEFYYRADNDGNATIGDLNDE